MPATFEHLDQKRVKINQTNQFRKRHLGLMRKANQLYEICGAEVVVIIRKNNRYFIYNSSQSKDWPPSFAEMVYLPLKLYSLHIN